MARRTRWLQRWLMHPAYDKYWQDMVPYKNDFARVNIPVLTITGYYDDGQISALQYLKQHMALGRKPEHYLVIGPYDHLGTHWSKKPEVLRDYAIDPVAQIDSAGIETPVHGLRAQGQAETGAAQEQRSTTK